MKEQRGMFINDIKERDGKRAVRNDDADSFHREPCRVRMNGM